MEKPSEKYAISRIPAILAELLDVPEDRVILSIASPEPSADLYLEVGQHAFWVEYKSSSAKALLLAGFMELHKNIDKIRRDALPLLVVPHMGEIGKRYCKEHRLSWFDLSGNAHIRRPGLFIHVEGRPNRFVSRGRPQNMFAPKSSRIARYFLINPYQRLTQRELSQKTGIDEGHTSRLVRKLEQDKLIDRDESGALGVPDPNGLLEAWYEAYDFKKHHIIKGHVAARSGDALLRRMADFFAQNAVDYAATGLGAAWIYCHFATFRVATFYLRHLPSDDVFGLLNFREDKRGANTWIVIPSDEGVFYGTEVTDEIPCVHPVQVYLDLKGHPERASEAAATLREDYLIWRRHA
jgi:hypothetical protein